MSARLSLTTSAPADRMDGAAPSVRPTATPISAVAAALPPAPTNVARALPPMPFVPVLDVGVSASEPPTVGRSVDAFDRAPRRVTSEPQCNLDAPRAAESPLAMLRVDQAARVEVRLAEHTVGVEQALDLPVGAALELSHFPPTCSAVERVQTGSLLLASDAKSGMLEDEPRLVQIANRLATNSERALDDWRTYVRQHAAAILAGRLSVQALVQRVLRESYMLNTEMLMEYAAKVKLNNECKKKTRLQMQEAREKRTAWGREEKAEGTFLADEPFAYTLIDPATGEAYVPAMTAADVDAWHAVTAAAGGTSEVDIAADYAALVGPSKLSKKDVAFMRGLVEDKGSDWFGTNDLTDDVIVEELDRLTEIVPRMNKQELAELLLPVLGILSAGDTDEGAIIDILTSLTPCQALYMKAGGIDINEWARKHTSAHGDNAETPMASSSAVVSAAIATYFTGAGVGTALGAVAGWFAGKATHYVTDSAGLNAALDSALGGLDTKEKARIQRYIDDAAVDVTTYLGAHFSGHVSKKEAATLLLDLAAKASASSSAPDATKDPLFGTPKAVRTAAELDDYIHELETSLNNLGDDGQLAQVDLQNTLQKQQQVLQMLNNLSKMLHDTAMSLVRKVGI